VTSPTVAVSVQGRRIPLSRRRVAEIAASVLRAERVREATLSITFLPSRAIAALNARYLGHRGPTDVIAFAFTPPGRDRAPLVGDIYIGADVARSQARRLGISVREELARLIVHGTLHVLGYDHPRGPHRVDSPMWRRQERLLARVLGGVPR
jgi:probable rRNA maturation factor